MPSSMMRSLLFTLSVAGTVSLSAMAGTAATTAKRAGPPSVAKYAGFAAPESVVYDEVWDRYLVSNVNGDPLARDGNGFISTLSPDGRVQELKWIEAGRGGVKLDAPKGLAIANGKLYVADISVVRVFDLKTGAPRDEVAVRGSTSLSGIAASPAGRVYVTDAGPPTGRLDGVGTEAVYVLEGRRAKLIAKGDTLSRPDAIAWTPKGLVVSSFGANEIYRLDDKGKRHDVTTTPKGGLAGVVAVGDSLLVTSWQDAAIYRGTLGGHFEVAFADQRAPGDLGFDSRRSRVLVPHFTDNSVEALELK
jgi:hypothetical protein